MTPLLSAVIPTFRRPALLERAIISALHSAPDDDVEVIVIPNGPDVSWKLIAETHKANPRIHWHSLPNGNASAARNYGLAMAQGKYVRVLDDDDYLYPAAIEQLTQIENLGADLCSAPLETVSPDGVPDSVFSLPETDDFVTASLLAIAISGFAQGSVFLRSAIHGISWPEDVVLYDDYLWMLRLAGSREMAWFQSRSPVGAYVQHHNARLSRTRRSNRNSQPLVASILKLYEGLSATARLTPARSRAIATALLTHAHSAFPSSPSFLGKAIQKAQSIAPDAVPMQALFGGHPWLANHLLAAEWAMVTPRYLTRSYRRASWLLKDKLSRTNG